ncbi:MAG: DNA-3-methyladenine glycosylase [Cyclobacteriaceae bacterium]|nr:DNA-3-methyladenine glycosylase [Cyclobacteriaceae bacterium]
MKLEAAFYQRNNVVKIARELLGKILVTRVGGHITSGMIVETEAYSWKERGCHAYGGRKTARNSVMFMPGGYAYVYLCYGMHNMVNVVTNSEGVAEAVLIRAVEPIRGVDVMMERRNTDATNLRALTSGPGKLAAALGISRDFNGKSLLGEEIWIEQGEKILSRDIVASARIGIAYALEDAKLPWRFYIRGHEFVSKI